jgi:hypothetical protein
MSDMSDGHREDQRIFLEGDACHRFTEWPIPLIYAS